MIIYNTPQLQSATCIYAILNMGMPSLANCNVKNNPTPPFLLMGLIFVGRIKEGIDYVPSLVACLPLWQRIIHLYDSVCH